MKAKNSGLRHRDVAIKNDGLDRLRPAPDAENRCTAKNCPYLGTFRRARWGNKGYAVPSFLCWHHHRELERLMRAQGKDWGGERKVGDVRLFYSSKRGYHGY
jgi:hypothetical protein